MPSLFEQNAFPNIITLWQTVVPWCLLTRHRLHAPLFRVFTAVWVTVIKWISQLFLSKNVQHLLQASCNSYFRCVDHDWGHFFLCVCQTQSPLSLLLLLHKVWSKCARYDNITTRQWPVSGANTSQSPLAAAPTWELRWDKWWSFTSRSAPYTFNQQLMLSAFCQSQLWGNKQTTTVWFCQLQSVTISKKCLYYTVYIIP